MKNLWNTLPRIKMIRNIKERRTRKRRQITVPISYGYIRKQTFIINSGTTFDLSNTGISFYTDNAFQEGINVQIFSSYLWELPRVGIVKWCSMKNIDFYKVGIQFR